MFNAMARYRVTTVAVLSLVVSASIFPATAVAQESDNWKFRVTPYFWFLGVDGTTALLGNDVDFDADFSDLADVLNYAISVNMELSKGKFFIVLDPMLGVFEMDYSGPGDGPIEGTVDADLLIADLDVGYNVNENFGLYVGARLYDNDITVTPNLLPRTKLGDDWTDFIVGLRVGGDVSENWSFMGKIDTAVSGDSESAFYVQATMLRHFGDNKHLDIGWRYYDVDYESGIGPTRFKWAVEHSGPVVGFSWEFGG